MPTSAAFSSTLRTALRAIDAEFALAPPRRGSRATRASSPIPTARARCRHLAALLPADAVDRAMALIRQDTAHAPADPEAFIEDLAGGIPRSGRSGRAAGDEGAHDLRGRDNYVLGGSARAPRCVRAHGARSSTAFAEALQSRCTAVAAALLRELVRSPADASAADSGRSDRRRLRRPARRAGTSGRRSTARPSRCSLRAMNGCTSSSRFARSPGPRRFTPSFGFCSAAPGSAGWTLTDLPLAVVDDARPASPRSNGHGERARCGRAASRRTRRISSACWAARRRPAWTSRATSTRSSLRTGWNRDDVEFLAGPQVLGLAFPDGFRDGRFLADMEPGMAQLRRLGIAASTAQMWSDAVGDAG